MSRRSTLEPEITIEPELPAPSRAAAEGATGSRFGRARAELRALFDEVAEVDWRSPAWSLFVDGLAASEALSSRAWSAETATDAFTTALRANAGLAADTFMASAADPPSADADARARRAATRAGRVAATLTALDDASPDQRLLQRLATRGGWLVSEPLPAGPVGVAFLRGDSAYLASVVPGREDPSLLTSLAKLARGEAPDLERVDPRAREATAAAAAIAIDPVPLRWARSFHRLAWTRGGGPWMGVADAPPFAVVSTCHAAIDGYLHARVTGAVLRAQSASPAPPTEAIEPPSARLAPPEVAFATHRWVGPPPRFAAAMHAFATVLDGHLGRPERHGRPGRLTVPFHVPIAPGHRADHRRWRQRPLYGLLALRKGESVEALGARLPSFLAREAAGRGVLTRVLRATLELPVPRSFARRLVDRAPWADRFVAPAAVLTGGGYFSWMRFGAGEAPAIPTYPSAIPSFTSERGGAGLSIAHYEGGLAIGLTTSGPLGNQGAAEAFLRDWLAALDGKPPALRRG